MLCTKPKSKTVIGVHCLNPLPESLPRLPVAPSLAGADLHAACVLGISDIECWDGECIRLRRCIYRPDQTPDEALCQPPVCTQTTSTNQRRGLCHVTRSPPITGRSLDHPRSLFSAASLPVMESTAPSSCQLAMEVSMPFRNIWTWQIYSQMVISVRKDS